MDIITQAKEIVLRDLRSCYNEQGIWASRVNFSDYWCRDSFWASIGMLEAGVDIEKVKNSLKLFLKYQREDGKIPRKLTQDYNWLKYAGIKIKRRKINPVFSPFVSFWSFCADDDLLLIIAFCKYIEKNQG